ncbi:hypothetical protein, partial [Pseudomonas sp. KCJK9111]|uniref:hypothetical protein n=1 Tax=Pseudomonas sp. KCJK9111 TaxID=3344555 RepID=UPI0039069635
QIAIITWGVFFVFFRSRRPCWHINIPNHFRPLTTEAKPTGAINLKLYDHREILKKPSYE